MALDDSIFNNSNCIDLETESDESNSFKNAIIIPLLVVGITFIIFGILSASLLIFIDPDILSTGEIQPWHMQILSALELFFLLVPINIYRKNWKERLGFKVKNISKIVVESAIGIALGFVVLGINALVGLIQHIITNAPDTSVDYSFMVSKDPNSLVIWFVIMIFIIGFSEETLFRGYLQTRFIEGFTRSYGSVGKLVGIIFASIIFAVVHLNIEGFLALFAMGIALGVIYEWRKNIYVVAFAHGVQNAIVILLVYLF